ncbi:sensor histidine kinase [Pseudomonas syringae]|nr:sensor histidine kinase [Pseudomonas syringae]MCF5070438.1 sensor histidine kinase [Pseudomonas syringae]
MGADQAVVADIATIGRISAVPAMLQVVQELTGLRFAAVARVTEDSWTACAVLDRLNIGLQVGGELEVSSTLCHEVRAHHVSVLIDKASDDPLYRDHHTPRLYQFESYISVPVFRTDGRFFGTICALDPTPAELKSSSIRVTLESFARLLALQIEAEENQQRAESELQAELDTSVLREQFIAVLGHDLRNPLFAISAGAEMLLRKNPEPPIAARLTQILGSARRATRLVDDVLDFARGRQGKGIPLRLQTCTDVRSVLEQVVGEIQSVHPGVIIDTRLDDLPELHCDRERLGQLLSNLLANAVAHGEPGGTVEVRATIDHEQFVLTVKNEGQIADSALPFLFQPYSRPAQGETPRAGLGLGLYIASQIAKSHGGTLEATSDAQNGTVFIFHLPIA